MRLKEQEHLHQQDQKRWRPSLFFYILLLLLVVILLLVVLFNAKNGYHSSPLPPSPSVWIYCGLCAAAFGRNGVKFETQSEYDEHVRIIHGNGHTQNMTTTTTTTRGRGR